MFAPLMLALLGCNSYETVAEACNDKVPGEKHIDADADFAFLQRINCYRRLTKSGQAPAEKALQDSTEAHVDYLTTNELCLDSEDPFRQNPGMPGFTGVDLFSRIEAAGGTYEYGGIAIQQHLYYDGFFGAEVVDRWMFNPWARGGYLTQDVYAIAASQTLENEETPCPMSYVVQAYTLPEVAVASAPRIYPARGQTGVPTSWVPSATGVPEELLGEQVFGFPVSFIVGLQETAVDFKSVLMTTESGELIDIVTYTPNLYDIPIDTFDNVLVIIPQQPLAENTTYLVDVQITSDQGERRAKTEFTTGTEPFTAARTAPEMPRVVTRTDILLK